MSLNNYSFESTSLLTRKLSDRNLLLGTLPETPLHTLAGLSSSNDLIVRSSSGATAQPLCQILSNAGVGNKDFESEHGRSLDEMVRVIATIVQGNLSVARNVVNPLVNQVLDQVTVAVNESISNAGSRISVLPESLGSIWQSPVLYSMLERYESTGLKQDYKIPYHPQLDTESISALLVTGSKRFDDEVAEWLATLPGGLVTQTYDSVFVQRAGNGARDVSTWSDAQSINGANTLLLALLLTTSLIINIQDGINMSLPEYKAAMTDLQSQLSVAVLNVVRRRERNLKQKRLVLDWASSYSESPAITVNADVYDQWITAGGTPEILFGANYTDREQDYDTLLAKSEEYTKAWATHRGRMVATATANKFTVMKTATRTAVDAAIELLPPEFLVNGTTGSLHIRANELLEHLTIRDLDDTARCVRHLVCKTIFPHTNALRILETMDKLATDNPDQDMREIALLATVDLIVEYLGDQITVTRTA